MHSTRNDLPQFFAGSIEQGEQDANGYIAWTLRGKLNRTTGIPTDTWCFLLLPGQGNLTGTFTLSNELEGEASFATDEKQRPDVIGIALAQLSSYWRPHQIWMIEEGPAGWTEQVFSASDAVEDHVIGTDGQSWRRLRKAPSVLLPDSSNRIVPGGWDHEHCSVCNTHVDPNDRFFYSPNHNEYLCVSCYEKYVPEHDISFALE
jgi:hypothetical protein